MNYEMSTIRLWMSKLFWILDIHIGIMYIHNRYMDMWITELKIMISTIITTKWAVEIKFWNCPNLVKLALYKHSKWHNSCQVSLVIVNHVVWLQKKVCDFINSRGKPVKFMSSVLISLAWQWIRTSRDYVYKIWQYKEFHMNTKLQQIVKNTFEPETFITNDFSIRM